MKNRSVGWLLIGLVLTGCGGTPAAPPSSPSRSAPALAQGPSDEARLVCTGRTAEHISGALGIAARSPLQPTWTEGVYACDYVYPDGSTMRLAVKDLPDAAATTAYFEAKRVVAGEVTPLEGMGEGAFARADGSVVVRKDDNVLVVDVTALPAAFGAPPRSRANVARTVATTVLICWVEY
ncbi:hypothetical protein OHV05_32100 [Kitasatospora sp. NBC_00070]|uniref:hypothetical protein n=1 Tax=Kitasatospora sp. NBC_00070 TaxID=2975962 RepID=UPI0032518621